jgi:hypothetical protein
MERRLDYMVAGRRASFRITLKTFPATVMADASAFGETIVGIIAVIVHAPAQHIPLEDARRHPPLLRGATEELSALLGTASG